MQIENKTLTRDQFRRVLIYEEKMMEVATNSDKLDHQRFIKLVSKNLMIMLHLRKKFGAYLDLDDHDSIKEALFALL